MKTLRFFVFLLVAIYFFAQPNNSAGQAKSDSNGDTKAAVASPQNTEATSDKKKPDNSSFWLYTALKDPNWWLAAIALFTGVAIVIQAREMKRATKVMERNTEETKKSAEAALKSANLQDAASRQYVIIQDEDWRISSPIGPNDRRQLVVSFPISNGTMQMITVNTVEGVFGERPFKIPEPFSIIPDKPQKVATVFDFTEAMEKDFNTKNFTSWPVSFTVCFTDAQKRTERQSFAGTIIRYIGKDYRFESESNVFLTDATQRDDGQQAEKKTAEKPPEKAN